MGKHGTFTMFWNFHLLPSTLSQFQPHQSGSSLVLSIYVTELFCCRFRFESQNPLHKLSQQLSITGKSAFIMRALKKIFSLSLSGMLESFTPKICTGKENERDDEHADGNMYPTRHGKINRTRLIYSICSSHRRLHTHTQDGKCLKIEVYVYVFIFRAENWIINKFCWPIIAPGKLMRMSRAIMSSD